MDEIETKPPKKRFSWKKLFGYSVLVVGAPLFCLVLIITYFSFFPLKTDYESASYKSAFATARGSNRIDMIWDMAKNKYGDTMRAREYAVSEIQKLDDIEWAHLIPSGNYDIGYKVKGEPGDITYRIGRPTEKD